MTPIEKFLNDVRALAKAQNVAVVGDYLTEMATKVYDRVTKLVEADQCLEINSFDCDGVIYLNSKVSGVNPGRSCDVIITGRSVEEKPETLKMLSARRIDNHVFFNPLPFEQKTRESSGIHKGNTINMLRHLGVKVVCHFEDDPIQAAEIKKLCPDVHVIMLVHDLTTLENVRHL